MSFLISKTLAYAIPLMIVALAGVFAERSGVINLALEGIMIFGAFMGALMIYLMQKYNAFGLLDLANTRGALSLTELNPVSIANHWNLQPFLILIMLITAACGAVFSLLLAFAAINLKADQTIGGTALNMLSPAIACFFIRLITQKNELGMFKGDAASWFIIKKQMFFIDKDQNIGFLGDAFVDKVYLTTYICIVLFVILSIFLYKTRFGLRLRSCGENPQAAASLGINVYKMRYAGVMISGALAGMGGFVYMLTTANCIANGDVAGFGFLALAVMIFGNWNPWSIAGAALLFGLFKCIAASYSTLDINGDGIFFLTTIPVSSYFYMMLPYLITLIVLSLTSKKSRAPKAEGIPYDKGMR